MIAGARGAKNRDGERESVERKRFEIYRRKEGDERKSREMQLREGE